MVLPPCTDQGTNPYQGLVLPLKLQEQFNLKAIFAYYCHIILLGYKQFERKLMKIYTKIASNKYIKLIWKVAFKLKGKI